MSLLEKIKEKVKFYGKKVKETTKEYIAKMVEIGKNFINSVIDTIYDYYMKRLERWREANRMKEEFGKPLRIDVLKYLIKCVKIAYDKWKLDRRTADYRKKTKDSVEFDIWDFTDTDDHNIFNETE